MKLCTVGVGYVGLVSAACFAEMGNHVICVDSNQSLIKDLQKGIIHIFEAGLASLVHRNMLQNRLAFTSDFSEGIKHADIIFICVGTPPLDDGSCDLQHVLAVAQEIGREMQESVIVVNKSTVPVGTADLVEETICQELHQRNLALSFSVVSNPEFLKEGDAVNDFMKPDRVIIGTVDTLAAQTLTNLYAPFARTRDKILQMSPRSAEMTKYAANCMLATKISFINEIAGICEQIGADVRDVRAGIGADQRIGYHFIYPGLGYGGSCFPKDVKALIHTAKTADFEPELLLAVDSVNNRQKRLMAKRILDCFGSYGGVQGKTLAVWGLSFKANTDDLRESASLIIIEILTSLGMRVQAYDPEANAKAQSLFQDNELVDIMPEQYMSLKNADALLVATEWNQFRTPDFQQIKNLLRAPLLFDGRNLYNPDEVSALGFIYFGIGCAVPAPL